MQRHKTLLCVCFALFGMGRSGQWWKKAGERKVLKSWVLINLGECEVGGVGIHATAYSSSTPRVIVGSHCGDVRMDSKGLEFRGGEEKYGMEGRAT